MGDNAASALFFLRFGVDFLPYMYLILGGITFVLTLGYSAGLGRLGRNRFFQGMILGLGILLLIERLALVRPFSLLYPVLMADGQLHGFYAWHVHVELGRRGQRRAPGQALVPAVCQCRYPWQRLGKFGDGPHCQNAGHGQPAYLLCCPAWSGLFSHAFDCPKIFWSRQSDRQEVESVERPALGL